MKSDRFLIFTLIGIGILAVLAVVVFFVHQGSQAYTSDNSPQGVVQNYLAAFSQENFDLAYQYLAQGANKPTREQFQQNFVNIEQYITEISVLIAETNLVGNQAEVTLIIVDSRSGAFGGIYRQQVTVSLLRQDGAWKISNLPYPFWWYAWGQPVPVEPPPQTAPGYP